MAREWTEGRDNGFPQVKPLEAEEADELENVLPRSPVTAEAGVEQSGIEDAATEEHNTDDQEAALSKSIEELCLSKAEEFQLIGYEHVTGQEIWECISDSYHKKGTPPLHQIVNDILSLKVTKFMNWMTMSIYKDNRF